MVPIISKILLLFLVSLKIPIIIGKQCPETDFVLYEIDQIMFPRDEYENYVTKDTPIINFPRFQLLQDQNGCSTKYYSQEQKLVLSGCQELSKSGNNTSFTNIKTVVLTMSSISKITSNLFPLFSDVQKIIITDNDQLTEIENDSFFNCSSLETLIINNNYKLGKISEQTFNSLFNLTELQLKNNNFKKISQITYSIQDLPNLNILDIRGNPFTSIEQYDFKPLLNISELLFSVQELATLGKNPTYYLGNLEKLTYYSEFPNLNDKELLLDINKNLNLFYIDFNNIDTQDKSYILTQTLMDYMYTTIKLKNSRIRRIDYEWLNSNTWILNIDISDSVFDEFPSPLFDSLMFPILEKLILRNNNFKFLPNHFWIKSNIELLDLSGNNLISLKSNSFAFAPSLKVLILSKAMVYIDDNAFNGMDKLIMLDLNNNDFSVSSLLFNNMTFNGLNNLQALDLSNCRIKRFKSNVFDNFINLKFLSLKSNKIEHIDNELFKPMECLSKLDLRDNYFLHFNPSFFRQNIINDIGLNSKIYRVDDKLIRFLEIQLVMDKISSDIEDCSQIVISDNFEIDKFGGNNKPSNDKCKIYINQYKNSDNNDYDDFNIDADLNFTFIESVGHPIYVIKSFSFDIWSVLRFLYVFTFYLLISVLLMIILLKIVQFVRRNNKKRMPRLILSEDKIDYCGVENKAYSVPYEKMKG